MSHHDVICVSTCRIMTSFVLVHGEEFKKVYLLHFVYIDLNRFLVLFSRMKKFVFIIVYIIIHRLFISKNNYVRNVHLDIISSQQTVDHNKHYVVYLHD